MSYPNHGLVLLDDVGETRNGTDNALYCVSDLSNCCAPDSSFRGEFHFPHGSVVPALNDVGNSGYYQTRAADRIGLNRMPTGTTTGIFHCRILTQANKPEDLYIGVYDADHGNNFNCQNLVLIVFLCLTQLLILILL